MSVKIYDTMTTATSNFPLAYAEKINIVKEDGSEADIQTLYNNGELSGGDTSIITTEAEYLALPEEQKLNNSYYLYDIGVHYKNGVAYSRKKPIQLTMEEYKALGEVDPDQEYIVSADTEGILLEASDISYSNAVSNLPCTTVQGAIDDNSGRIAEVETKLGEKVDYKVVVEDGSRYVEDIVTQDINTWLPNDNSSIVINLKKTNGINYLNFQLLCNKKDSKNWSCIVNGAADELWKIRYIDGVRYIDELATMDKVVKTKIIRITGDSTNLYQSMYGGKYYRRIIGNFFSDNGINQNSIVSCNICNNGNDLDLYYCLAGNMADELAIFKFADVDNTYIEVKVAYI